jgi:hypothetical protein
MRKTVPYLTVMFTDEELARLKEHADREGITPEQYAHDKIIAWLEETERYGG